LSTTLPATSDGGMPAASTRCIRVRSALPAAEMPPPSSVSEAGRFLDPRNRFVAIVPGHSAVTPMGAAMSRRSLHSTSDSAIVACLVMPYMLVAAVTEVIEQVLTMCPCCPCASIRGTNVCTPWTTDQKLTPTVHSQSRPVAAQIGPSRYPSTPALLCTRWTGPKAASAASARASTSAGDETSVRRPSTGPPVAEISATTASSASG
jgi:hypothetical protein